MLNDEYWVGDRGLDQHAEGLRLMEPTCQGIQNDASREVRVLRTIIGKTANTTPSDSGSCQCWN